MIWWREIMKYKEITFKPNFQYEHVWKIVKDSPMYAPRSSRQQHAKNTKTYESSGALINCSNDDKNVDGNIMKPNLVWWDKMPQIGKTKKNRKDKERVFEVMKLVMLCHSH